MNRYELLSMCKFEEITPQKLASCDYFECENKDLNDFFANDAVKYAKRLLGKTYVFCLKENPNTIVAAFTVSNDSIRMTNKLNEESKQIFLHDTSLEDKCLRRFPAYRQTCYQQEFCRKRHRLWSYGFHKILV